MYLCSSDPIMTDFSKYRFRDVIVKPYGVGELNDVLRRVIEEERTNETQDLEG